MSSRPKVLVSGCYDLLHAGHVAFFETAAQYGDLYVCIGSDENIRQLKNHAPKFTQQERLYIVQSIRYVTQARVSSGTGMLDFEPDMAELKPELFIVNEDGGSEDKRRLCEKYNVRYVVLTRTPKPGLPARSSTGIKESLAADSRSAP
jgi:cytidyltransferase-like protein